MKNFILSLLILPLAFTAFSQNDKPAELYYELHGNFANSVSQAILKKATTLSEINDKYPAEWIREYLSVEIIATCNGVLKHATGVNEKLNAEQINIIKMADCGSKLLVDVKYIPDNTLKQNDVQNINFSLTLLPETSAQFPGGSDQMMQYLKENVENKIPESTPIESIKWSSIRFVIDADGKIINARAIGSTEYSDIDKILMDAICEMPPWSPATDSNNAPVDQEFEFVFGNTLGMCNLNFYYLNN